MSRKIPKCSKGFPCGKTCISRNNSCFANLSTQDSRIAETFSQFVNRLVGIGNNNQSAVKNKNPLEVTATTNNRVNNLRKIKEIAEAEIERKTKERSEKSKYYIDLAKEFSKISSLKIDDSGEQAFYDFYYNNLSDIIGYFLYDDDIKDIKDIKNKRAIKKIEELGITDDESANKFFLNAKEVLIKSFEDDKKLRKEIDQIKNKLIEDFSINYDSKELNRDGLVSDNIKNRKLPSASNLDANNTNKSNNKIREMINNSAMMSMTSIDAIIGIINEGELKNNYENDSLGIAGTQTESRKKRYNRLSRERDKDILNIDDNINNSDRPTYGFLANPDDLLNLNEDTGLNKYGDIIIQFKPYTKDNATATLDDSLSPNAFYNQKGSPINDAYFDNSKQLRNPDDEKQLNANNYKSSLSGGPPYIEWQSGGKLYLSDIEFIHIPISLWDTLPKETKDLILNNIEVQFLPK